MLTSNHKWIIQTECSYFKGTSSQLTAPSKVQKVKYTPLLLQISVVYILILLFDSHQDFATNIVMTIENPVFSETLRE